jgi:hypothetical protein
MWKGAALATGADGGDVAPESGWSDGGACRCRHVRQRWLKGDAGDSLHRLPIRTGHRQRRRALTCAALDRRRRAWVWAGVRRAAGNFMQARCVSMRNTCG